MRHPNVLYTDPGSREKQGELDVALSRRLSGGRLGGRLSRRARRAVQGTRNPSATAK